MIPCGSEYNDSLHGNFGGCIPQTHACTFMSKVQNSIYIFFIKNQSSSKTSTSFN